MTVRFAILVVALLAVSCTDATPTRPTPIAETPNPVVRLFVRVVDYHTGAAVPGVTVSWRSRVGSSLSTSEERTSDANGRFEIALPPSESFTFQSPLGDRRLQPGLVRVPGKRLDTDLLVNGGPCVARYGTVFDAVTREPIAGARVTRAGSAVTDADGYYRIDIGCEPRDGLYWGIGTTIISVQHPAYQGAFEFDGRREFTGGSGVRRVDFALTPLASS